MNDILLAFLVSSGALGVLSLVITVVIPQIRRAWNSNGHNGHHNGHGNGRGRAAAAAPPVVAPKCEMDANAFNQLVIQYQRDRDDYRTLDERIFTQLSQIREQGESINHSLQLIQKDLTTMVERSRPRG